MGGPDHVEEWEARTHPVPMMITLVVILATKNTKMEKELLDAFAPESPKTWTKNPNEWLSSIDIMNVMKANRDECVLCCLVVVVYSVEGGDRNVIFLFFKKETRSFFLFPRRNFSSR